MTRILVMRKQISRELETNVQKHANIHHLFIFIFFPLVDILKRSFDCYYHYYHQRVYLCMS